jgi:hypothetical protein
MSFAAQVRCEDGTIYDIEGEGGNTHAYRITWGPREGLGEAFDSVPEALAAIQVHAGSNVDWDSYELHRGDDEEYWPDDDD